MARAILLLLTGAIAGSGGAYLYQHLIYDWRHAIRLYVRTPGQSLIAIVVLTTAVAFVGAFLSLYVDLVLRPHPGFEQSNQIATVGKSDETEFSGIPYAIIDRIPGEMDSVESAAAVSVTNQQVGPEREDTVIELVSREFFSGLRPRLAAGRGFLAEEHLSDSEPVVVLSYRYWRDRYDSDPDVLGTTLAISRRNSFSLFGPGGRPGQLPGPETQNYRIVGVMTETLPGLMWPETSLWLPLERAFPSFEGSFERLPEFSYQAFIRRSPGASIDAITQELNARYADDPALALPAGARMNAVDGAVREIEVQRAANRQLQLFLTGSLLLAVVAAANISLFLLARAPGRRRELGIRLAVGAATRRIARQLVSEAALLVAVSALLGLALGLWLSAYLRGLALFRDAEWHHVSFLDWRVWSLFALFLVFLTLVVSLAPAIGLERLGIAARSQQTSARASAAQRIAGSVQVAIAGALGGAAIAFGWYLGVLVFGNAGYEVDNRYFARFESTLSESGGSRVELARQRQAIEAIPGVSAAAFGRPVPGEADWYVARTLRVPDPGDAGRDFQARMGEIDGAFIDVLGLRLIHGRKLEDFESGVALVNRSFARLVFARDDVVGERIPNGIGDGSVEIIGVLEELSFEHPSAAVVPYVFLSHTGINARSAVIESELTAAELQQALQLAAGTGELELGVEEVQSLRALRNDWIAPDRMRGLLTMTLAALVVFLSALGFYGTQRYLVVAGQREYAIRAALGAGPRALGRLVFRRGIFMCFPGLVVGGLLAYIVVALLRSDFVSRDVSALIVAIDVVAGLFSLILVASMGPAREARRAQPTQLLREN